MPSEAQLLAERERQYRERRERLKAIRDKKGAPFAGTRRAGAFLARGASALVPGGPWGAGAGMLGEAIGQTIEPGVLEGTRSYNPGQIATQGALGAIPFGRVASVGRAAAKGAVLGAGSAVATQQADRGLHVPDREDVPGIAYGTAFGSAGGAISGYLARRAGGGGAPGEPNPPSPGTDIDVRPPRTPRIPPERGLPEYIPTRQGEVVDEGFVEGTIVRPSRPAPLVPPERRLGSGRPQGEGFEVTNRGADLGYQDDVRSATLAELRAFRSNPGSFEPRRAQALADNLTRHIGTPSALDEATRIYESLPKSLETTPYHQQMRTASNAAVPDNLASRMRRSAEEQRHQIDMPERAPEITHDEALRMRAQGTENIEDAVASENAKRGMFQPPPTAAPKIGRKGARRAGVRPSAGPPSAPGPAPITAQPPAAAPVAPTMGPVAPIAEPPRPVPEAVPAPRPYPPAQPGENRPFADTPDSALKPIARSGNKTAQKEGFLRGWWKQIVESDETGAAGDVEAARRARQAELEGLGRRKADEGPPATGERRSAEIEKLRGQMGPADREVSDLRMGDLTRRFSEGTTARKPPEGAVTEERYGELLGKLGGRQPEPERLGRGIIKSGELSPEYQQQLRARPGRPSEQDVLSDIAAEEIRRRPMGPVSPLSRFSEEATGPRASQDARGSLWERLKSERGAAGEGESPRELRDQMRLTRGGRAEEWDADAAMREGRRLALEDGDAKRVAMYDKYIQGMKELRKGWAEEAAKYGKRPERPKLVERLKDETGSLKIVGRGIRKKNLKQEKELADNLEAHIAKADAEGDVFFARALRKVQKEMRAKIAAASPEEIERSAMPRPELTPIRGGRPEDITKRFRGAGGEGPTPEPGVGRAALDAMMGWKKQTAKELEGRKGGPPTPESPPPGASKEEFDAWVKSLPGVPVSESEQLARRTPKAKSLLKYWEGNETAPDEHVLDTWVNEMIEFMGATPGEVSLAIRQAMARGVDPTKFDSPNDVQIHLRDIEAPRSGNIEPESFGGKRVLDVDALEALRRSDEPTFEGKSQKDLDLLEKLREGDKGRDRSFIEGLKRENARAEKKPKLTPIKGGKETLGERFKNFLDDERGAVGPDIGKSEESGWLTGTKLRQVESIREAARKEREPKFPTKAQKNPPEEAVRGERIPYTPSSEAQHLLKEWRRKAYKVDEESLLGKQPDTGKVNPPSPRELDEWIADQMEMGFTHGEARTGAKEAIRRGINPTNSDDLHDLANYIRGTMKRFIEDEEGSVSHREIWDNLKGRLGKITGSPELGGVGKAVRDKVPLTSIRDAVMGKSAGEGEDVGKFYGRENLTMSMNEELKRMGKEGQEIHRRLARADQFERQYNARWANKYKETTEPLSGEEFTNLVDHIEGRAKPLNETVRKAASVVREIFEDIEKEAMNLGVTYRTRGGTKVPFRKRGKGYWPVVPKVTKGIVDRLTRPDKFGMAMDPAEAKRVKALFKEHGEAIFDPESRFFKERLDYKKTRDVGQLHIEGMARHIARSRTMGNMDVKGVHDGIQRLIEKTPDPKRTFKLLERHLGRELPKPSPALNKFMRRVRTIQVWTKLQNFAIANALGGQGNIILKSTPRIYLREAAKYFKGDIAQKAITNEAGALAEVSHGMLEELSRHNPTKLYGIQATENLNRTIAAGVGRGMAQEYFKVLKKDPTNKLGRKRLAELALEDVDKILKQSELTEEQLRMAAGRMAEITQGLNVGRNLPYGWSDSHPLVQLATIFKKYAFQGTKATWDAIKEDPKRNIPIFLALTQIVGPLVGGSKSTTIGLWKALMEGKDPVESVKEEVGGRADYVKRNFGVESDAVARIMDNALQSFAFGIPADLLQALAQSKTGFVESVAGPAMGDVSRIGHDIVTMGQGGGKDLLKMGARSLPLPGGGGQALAKSEWFTGEDNVRRIRELRQRRQERQER